MLSFYSAECDTDHSLVVSTVHLLPRRVHRFRPKPPPHINIGGTAKPELQDRFAKAINEALEDSPVDSAYTQWNHIRGTVFQTALDIIGRRARKSVDWFEADATELGPVGATKQDPSAKRLAAIRAGRIDTKRVARQRVISFWLNFCQDIQHSVDTGNARRMYEGMKEAFGESAIIGQDPSPQIS